MYPEAIEQYINKVVSVLDEHGYFKNEQVPLSEKHVRNEFGPVLFEIWKRGDELILTPEKVTNLLDRASISTTIDKMIGTGELISFENENGEEMIMLNPNKPQPNDTF